MRSIVKRNKKNILLLGITMLILGMLVLPTILHQPTGIMSAGFMKDGEKVGTNPFLAFVNPDGVEVDSIWYKLEWIITGEFVDWRTFHIEGSYGIDLWHYSTGYTTIFENTFGPLDGETYYELETHIGDSISLSTLLNGQPYSASDADVWYLVFWGEFTTQVASEDDGHLLYDHWPDTAEGETGRTEWLTVYWVDLATFGGSGTVTTDTI